MENQNNQINPKNKNPFFVGGIIIIIIILIATGLTVWKYYKEISNLNNQEFEIVNFSINKKTETANNISDWKTYRNEEYGFEMKYPDIYIITEKNKKSIGFVNKKEKDAWEQGKIGSPIGNEISLNIIEDENFMVWRKEQLSQNKTKEKVEEIIRNATEVKIGNYSWTNFSWHEKGWGEMSEFFLQKNNIFIEITLLNYEKPNDIFYQILSTFKFIEQDKEILSSENIYFSEEKQGKITLYSPEMKIDENQAIWCGGPVVGAKKYQGNFYLSFEDSKLDIGEMNFIEDSRNDGKLWIKKLDPNSNQDFIIILQYGSCNHNEAKFYGYDFEQKKLAQYKFKKKSGEIWDEIYVAPTDNFLKILSSKNFSSTLNDGLMWKFNNEENIFEEITD